MSSWSAIASTRAAASVAGGRCGDESSGLTFIRSLATPSRPGVAPPIERFSLTARLKRVTRWSLRSNRYTPRTSISVVEPSAVPTTVPAMRTSAKSWLNLSRTFSTSAAATESIERMRGHGVGVGGPGGVGGDGAIGQEAVDGERIAGDVDQVELFAFEQAVGGGEAEPAAGILGDDQAAVVGELGRQAAVVDFDHGGGFVVVADRTGGERAGGGCDAVLVVDELGRDAHRQRSRLAVAAASLSSRTCIVPPHSSSIVTSAKSFAPTRGVRSIDGLGGRLGCAHFRRKECQSEQQGCHTASDNGHRRYLG